MCNAWNHPPGCNCGWGGVYYGSIGDPLSFQLRDIVTRGSASSGNRAETRLTSCRWCGVSVYYHTRGYGDSVYFDSLGYPWQVHECFKKYWESKKAEKRQSSKIEYFHWLNRKEICTDFFAIDVDRQKREVLIGVASQIPNVTVGQFLIYKATEDAFAEQMGISVEQLRTIYGHLYVQEVGGIRVSSEEELERKRKNQKSKKPKKPEESKKPEILSVLKARDDKPSKAKKPKPKPTSSSFTKSKKSSKKSSTSNLPKIVSCPFCNRSIKIERLQKHISKAH